MSLATATRLGPYEILGPLGAGGMGEVYRARDTRLDRTVALKVLPEEFFERGERRARFQREARTLASLNHPNIATLYSFEEIPGSPPSFTPHHVLVMELLEGETLREELMRGPLPRRRALEIAAQMADALAAAHLKEIVHRDVKPENVFLTRDGRAKLLDFGIARQRPPVAPADTVGPTITAASRPGVLVGTVAYMSPEQARGAAVDFRSDQFSLGVVLYEMLTGRRPFGGATPTDTLAAILRDEPEPLEKLDPAVPAQVQWIVDRCLAKEARERYDSTRDLARELENCRTRPGESADGVSATRAAAAAKRPASRWRVLATAGAAAAIALAALYVVRNRAAARGGASVNSTGLDPKRIAVASFENRTGDASLEPVARMSAEWVTQGLWGIRIDVVPSADVFDAPAAKGAPGSSPRESPRKLAERTGAGIVVSGAFYLEGADVRLHAQVSDMTSGRLLHALPPASAPRANPMPAIDAVRRQVRDALGVILGARGDDLLASESAPPKYEAYVEYTLGAEKAADDLPAAQAHLRKALEIDPDFVAARSALVGVLFSWGRYSDADRELKPLEERRGSLGPADFYWIDGQRAGLSGRHDDVLTAFRAAARLSPGNAESLWDLAASALRANHPAEAIEALTRPVRWDLYLNSSRSYAVFYFSGLCHAYHALGRHVEELAAAQRGRVVFPSKMRPVISEMKALVALGRIDEADRLLAESLTRTEFSRQTLGLMLEAAKELRAHGHRARAREIAEQCVAHGRGKPGAADGGERAILAQCLSEAGMWSEAVPVFEVLEKEQPRLDLKWRGLRAVAAWHAGDAATAAKIEDGLRRLDRPYLFGEHLFSLAELAAQQGKKEEAVSLLREALVQGYANGFQGIWVAAHTRSEFEPLRGYPPYEELIRPKG